MAALLKELCETPAIPGREQKIIDVMKRELKSCADDVSVDEMGNVLAYRKGFGKYAKKIMISGHMDEIGFVVSHIDKDGYIRFSPRGGHLPKVLLSQRVKIIGKKVLTGVVESSPAFLSLSMEHVAQASAIKAMHIDTGLTMKELKKYIAMGDMIVLDRDFVEQGEICIAKSFDDRIGCYVLIETMKRLKKKKLQVDLYAVGTTQEEVGLRGARSAAKNINPDIGIALDVTCAFDTPGVAPHEQVTKIGHGVGIKISDSSSISNHGVVEFMKKIAKANRIKHQMEILPFGGTDASAMQMFGSGPVCTLSIPTRYVHSPNEMLSMKDVEATISLLVKFIENAHTCKAEF